MTADRLRPVLAREHRQWTEEIMTVLMRAEPPDAGPWARWHALQYLQTTFAERLDQERRLVESVASNLTPDQRETLWALGELLDALRQHLDHLIGLCHRAEQFSTVTGRIFVALQHWCRAVEDDLGPLPAGVMNQQSRQATELVPESSVAIG